MSNMNVSVVIPSNRENILTIESVPDEHLIDLQVRRDNGLNAARNAGVRNAEYENIVILDDDLVFNDEWFSDICRRINDQPDIVWTAKGTGILAEVNWPTGFNPGMGRVLGFNKSVWRSVGGFPTPCSHGGDTDFLMGAYERGYRVVQLRHEWEHHDDDVDVYSFTDNLRWLWFLFRRHPRLVGPKIPHLLTKKVMG